MRLNEEVESVDERQPTALSWATQPREQEESQGDALLYAVGRQGNVDELNLRRRA